LARLAAFGLLDHVIELLHLLADDARGARAEQHEQRAAQTKPASSVRQTPVIRSSAARPTVVTRSLAVRVEFAAQSGVDAERLADLVDHEFAFRLAAQGIASTR